MKKYKLKLKQFEGYTFEELIASASLSKGEGRKRIFCVVTPKSDKIRYRIDIRRKDSKESIETSMLIDAIQEFNNIV